MLREGEQHDFQYYVMGTNTPSEYFIRKKYILELGGSEGGGLNADNVKREVEE